MPVSAQKTRILAGKFPLSTHATSLSTGVMRATLDRTTFTSTAQEFFLGQEMAELAVDALVDDATTANNFWETLTGFYAAGAAVPLSVSPGGVEAGSQAWMAEGYLSNLATTTAVADRVTASLTFTLTGGAKPNGVNLTAHEAVTTNTTGSAVDNAAGTTNGGVAHLHITEASGTSPQLDLVVQHSTNNSSWSTLTTFAQATGAGAQRNVVAAGTSVHRYIRANVTGVSGTNASFTISVAFARS